MGGMVLFGSLATLDMVWSLADVTMALMAICNLIAILFLGKYAIRLLNDYRAQRKLASKALFLRKRQCRTSKRTWNVGENQLFCTFARKLTDGSYVIYLPHAQIVNCK